jgi:prepilin-type N-terminal cleavage/methylation domain-containing protein
MRMKVAQHGRNGGFTLIEIMVVIAIIASLIAATSLMLSIGNKKKAQTETWGRLNGIGAAIEQLRSTDQLGRYPPTEITKLSFQGFDGKKFGQPNATNVGIETIYVAFRLPGINVTPSGVEAEDAVGNTDDDKASSMVGKMAKPDLFEYLDAWGNPLVYISASDYKDPSKVAEYVLGDAAHTHVKVAPKKNEKTGEFVRPDSFQLFSMGPDGIPGTDDDMVFGQQ